MKLKLFLPNIYFLYLLQVPQQQFTYTIHIAIKNCLLHGYKNRTKFFMHSIIYVNTCINLLTFAMFNIIYIILYGQIRIALYLYFHE